MAQGSAPGLSMQQGQELPRLLGSSSATEAARGAQHASKLIAGLFASQIAPMKQAPMVTPLTIGSICSTTDTETYDHVGPVIQTPEAVCLGSMHAENFFGGFGANPMQQQVAPAFGSVAPRILELQQALVQQQAGPAVLHLDSAIPAPAQGSLVAAQTAVVADAVVPSQGMMQEGGEALPSIGSVGHRLGVCKPCAFVFKEGCRSGAECKFCHLCDPGEKKRRKKERKDVRHTAARLQHA